MDTLRIETAQHVDITYEAAGVGDRVIASLIDFMIQLAVVIVAAIGEWLFLGGFRGVLLYIVIGLVTLYHPLCETFFDGRSPGKRSVGTRVARVDGARAGFGRYMLRWLIGLVEFWMTAGLAAIVAATINRRGQRIGDMAAGTAVIRVQPDSEVSASDLAASQSIEHVPIFPEAAALSTREIETIRAVVNQMRAHGRNSRTERLAERTKEVVEHKLGLSPAPQSPYKFLVQVLADHNNNSNTGEATSLPPSPERWQPSPPRSEYPASSEPTASAGV